MALTHRTNRHIELPHEPGAWVEVRMPSLDILDRAREARLKRVFGMMAGVDLTTLQGMRNEQPQQQSEQSEYDWQTLLGACITAWSYPEPATRENIVELDALTVQVIVDVLIPHVTEADRKNGSGGSTSALTETAFRPMSG